MTKEYIFEVDLKWDSYGTEAKSEQEARRIIKEVFQDDYNIKLKNDEIKLLQVVKTKDNKDSTKDITIE